MGEDEPGHRRAAVNTFPLNFGPDGAGDGRFCRTASGEWIPDGGAWQSQGYDENGLLRSLNGRLTGAHKVLRSAAEIACKGRQDFNLRHDGGYMIPIHSKIGQGTRINFEKLVNERTHSSLSRKQHCQFLPEPRSEIHRDQQCEQCSAVGKRLWQSSTLVSPTKNLNRDVAPIDDDIEAEIPRVRMNPKNPASREKQDHEDSGHVVCRSWCAACVEGRGVGGHHRIELLEEEERERATPIVAFDYGFLTQENADTFPILICRDSRYGHTGATCCERKGPTAYSTSFLVGFIKHLGFRKIISKCDNEPSTKALQDAVIHACARVEVIPQGPLEGDHMANGRVEMAVREVKRQCRSLRISAERDTSVRIADDSPLLSWLPRFAAQVMNKMRIGKGGKND